MSLLSDQFKYLFYQSYLTGLLPKFNRQTNNFKKCGLTTLFFIILGISTFSYTLYELFRNFPAVINFNSTTSIFQHILVNVLYLEFLITQHHYKFDKLQLLWETLQGIDIDFRTYFKTSPKEVKNITIMLCVTNGAYVLIHALDFWMDPIFRCDILFVCVIYIRFALQTSKFMMSRVVCAIVVRLQAVVDILEKNDAKQLTSSEVLIDIHTRIADAIDLFNDLYGPTLVISLLHLVLYALRLVSLFYEEQQTSSEHTMRIMLTLSTIYGFIQAIVLVITSQKVIDVGKLLLATTYKSMHYYTNIPMMRKCLSRLAKQIAGRSHIISAAGFCNVDLNLLFTMVNLVTTYTIVIVQFSASTNSRKCAEI